MKIMYVNWGIRTRCESDLRSSEGSLLNNNNNFITVFPLKGGS